MFGQLVIKQKYLKSYKKKNFQTTKFRILSSQFYENINIIAIFRFFFKKIALI